MSEGLYHVLINWRECRVLITRRLNDVEDLSRRGWRVDAVFTSFREAMEYAHGRADDEYIVEWYLEDEVEELEKSNIIISAEN